MKRVRSFPPIEDARARVLVLGSMPGRASLAAGKYYAHPRNLFWPIMLDLLGAEPSLTYTGRARLLKANGIALWDVLESCVREGSLDTAIEDDTIVPTDFESFYRRHPKVDCVFFNGAKAEAAYKRHVHATMEGVGGPRAYVRLPSTSPAHASRSFAQKLEAWRVVCTTMQRHKGR